MKSRFVSPEEAVSVIQSNQRIFLHGAAMTPHALVEAMMQRAHELRNVDIIHLHTEGQAPYANRKFKDNFHVNSFFVGGNLRKAVNEDNADYIPVFLSEIHFLFKNGSLKPDVALLQVSPPDGHGFCSLGASIDIAMAAASAADILIAEVNQQVPRTHGAGSIHINQFDYLVATNKPLGTHYPAIINDNTKKIGKLISQLVEDGATLQLGIGAIPDAVLTELGHHRKLGIHSEMISDGILPLVNKGVITCEEKNISRGKIVSSFVLGTHKIYDFINDNPMISMREASYTNDPGIIRMNPKVTAINSAIEIDITGQVCADTIGQYQFSGVGGQLDFIRAAALSDGGKPVIALESVTHQGESKIVPFLKQGAGVTTTRAHIHYVVTEYGITNLFGKNLRERAKALIEIAHPDHRETLYKAAFKRFKHL